MPRDLDKEIRRLKAKTSNCFKKTNLALRYRPTLLLALLGLQLNLREIHKARDPSKRVALIREFDRAKTVIHDFLDKAFLETGSRTIPPQFIRTHHRKADQRAA